MPKLFLFSDLHCNNHFCEQVVSQCKHADIAIGAGDFANCRRGLQPVIDVLCELTIPTVLVPGNSESFEELCAACADWSNCQVLHGSTTQIDDLCVFGLGGGIPVTPFGSWSYDFTEEEAKSMLQEAEDAKIWITHSPPYQCVDLSSSNRHLGSRAIRNAVERLQPRLLVCGHIHASSGKSQTIGNTTVVNAGPQGMFFDLNESS